MPTRPPLPARGGRRSPGAPSASPRSGRGSSTSPSRSARGPGSPLLVALGAVEFLWGVLTVSRPGVPVPRLAIAGALVPPAAWIVLLVTALPDGARPLPFLAATLLDLAVAIVLAAGLRRAPRAEPRHPLPGIAVAGLVVAAITVPALVATEAASRFPDAPPPVHEQTAH